MRISVLGGGHGGYAAAVDLTLRGFEVCLFTFSKERVRLLKERGNQIEYDGVWGKGSCKVACVTDQMSEAAQTDLLMMNVPGTGHEKYLKELKPHLRDDAILYMNPGHTGGALRAVKFLEKGFIAEANTLSYISRKTSECGVYVSSSDKPVTVGVFPACAAKEVIEKLRQVYPHIVEAKNVLESSLCNINAMFHPPGMLLNAGWIEHTQGDFRFYYDGITPGVGRVIKELDEERLAVAKAFGLKLDNFCTVLYHAGSTTEKAALSGDPYIACQESEVNKFIRCPDTLDHRYMHEDICSGLVPISALGHLAGVKVPLNDAMICMAGALMGRDYFTEGGESL